MIVERSLKKILKESPSSNFSYREIQEIVINCKLKSVI